MYIYVRILNNFVQRQSSQTFVFLSYKILCLRVNLCLYNLHGPRATFEMEIFSVGYF